MSAAPAPSLLRRLLVLASSLLSVVWLLTALVAWFDLRHEVDELLDAHLAQTAALLAAVEADELDSDDHGALLPAPALERRYQSRVAFQVWQLRRNGQRLLARSADAPAQPLASLMRPGLSNSTGEGEGWRVYVLYHEHTAVLVGERQSVRQHLALASVRSITVLLALGLPLLLLAMAWAIGRGLRPLRVLGREVDARRAQALDPLPEEGVPAEVLPLVRALNALFARVSAHVVAERRFTSDAAHELRTPLAAIRMQAQVALGAGDAAERTTALRATMQGCDRATHLVEQLLQLARLEAAASGVAQGSASTGNTVDVAEAARSVVADVLSAHPEVLSRIQLDAPAAARVAMPLPLVMVLLRNLIDNALRYSPDDAPVAVSVQASDGKVAVVVEDGGAGLAEAEQARLGERFFRVLGSGRDGSGLGWSIVRRLAELHAIDITLGRSATLGGLRVELRWVAAQA